MTNIDTVGDLLARATTWRERGLPATAIVLEERAERAVFGRIVTPDDGFTETPEPVAAVEPPRSWLDRLALWFVRRVQA